MTQYKVNENCIGCGACAAISESFEMQEDGKAKVIKQPVWEGELNNAQEAQNMCPVQAIETI